MVTTNKRGRYTYEGRNITNVRVEMKEITKDIGCVFCGTKEDMGVTLAFAEESEELSKVGGKLPLVNICRGCMKEYPSGEEAMQVIVSRLKDGTLNFDNAPSLDFEPTPTLFKTDKASHKVAEAFKDIKGIELMGSSFDIASTNHVRFEFGFDTIVYFRDTDEFMLVRLGDDCMDAIGYFDNPKWQDQKDIITFLDATTEIEKWEGNEAKAQFSAISVAISVATREWVKEVIYHRLHDEYRSRDESKRRRSVVKMLAGALEDMIANGEAECDCPDCRAEREQGLN